MGFRDTGKLYPRQPITILTCDQCNKDIGEKDYFEIVLHSPSSFEDSYNGLESLCSVECLTTAVTKMMMRTEK